jgi:hypothetical protein
VNANILVFVGLVRVRMGQRGRLFVCLPLQMLEDIAENRVIINAQGLPTNLPDRIMRSTETCSARK